MPDLVAFRRLVRSLAALDAVMSPEWTYRYYSEKLTPSKVGSSSVPYVSLSSSPAPR